MSSITIIGTGNMARAIGTLAVAGGNTGEIMGRAGWFLSSLYSTQGQVLAEGKLRILVHQMPERAQIDIPITEQLIVELYSK